ncbi:MAG: hypothetical protein J2P44_12660 [Candidatus Dormibacteraeota bacterium]|nr:hypothetical protein [Candidatus Dormibacteraeota bacterium]
MTSEPGDGLLPGELPDTSYPEDAQHWLTVYSELLRFATELEVPAYVDLYRRRLDFWRVRRTELGSSRGQS